VIGPAPVDVLYIAGSGRSGSTILDTVLGQVDGFFSAGELRYLWGRGVIEDRLCGCGQRFSRCPVWTRVLEHAGIAQPRAVAHEMLASYATVARVRHVPMLLRNRHRAGSVVAGLDGYGERLDGLYRAVRDVTGSEVIVDSSKSPAYGFLLSGIPGVNVHIVHMVRDPRAASFSWVRKKEQPDRTTPGYMKPLGTARSAALWTTWNTTARLLWAGGDLPYMVLRYEDFVADPEAAVKAILDLVGRPGRPLPFLGHGSVRLAPTHTVAGNPVRLQCGDVQLQADDEWITQMSPRAKRIVSAITAFAMGHFGYPVRVRASSSKAP